MAGGEICKYYFYFSLANQTASKMQLLAIAEFLDFAPSHGILQKKKKKCFFLLIHNWLLNCKASFAHAFRKGKVGQICICQISFHLDTKL